MQTCDKTQQHRQLDVFQFFWTISSSEKCSRHTFWYLLCMFRFTRCKDQVGNGPKPWTKAKHLQGKIVLSSCRLSKKLGNLPVLIPLPVCCPDKSRSNQLANNWRTNLPNHVEPTRPWWVWRTDELKIHTTQLWENRKRQNTKKTKFAQKLFLLTIFSLGLFVGTFFVE